MRTLIIILLIFAGHYLVSAQDSGQKSLYSGQDSLNRDSTVCMAIFIAFPDTTGLQSNTYSFIDLSLGNPTSWLWDFGDGNSSSEQNPDHHYNSSGSFTVCLTITSNNPAGYYCTDDTCMTIETPHYFDLGGFAFIGDFPINNPLPTGDTAVALLYRITNNQITPVDSLVFYELGYYWFTQLIKGNYMVKIKLTSNSLHSYTYMPAYYPDALTWTAASPINLTVSSLYNTNVYLLPCEFNPGPGEITGYVRFINDINIDPEYSLRDVEILLYGQDGRPLQSTFSDETGRFVFTDLVYGTYKLIADVTGLYSDFSSVSITPDSPIASSIDVIVHEQTVFGFDESITSIPFTLESIYPVPVFDELNIEVSSDYTITLLADVLNNCGQLILSRSCSLASGRQIIRLPVGMLDKGLYLLRIQSTDGKVIHTKKFIK
jgi:PKD repeat protein